MQKVSEFVEEAERELADEKTELAKEEIKERLREIGAAKKTLARMERSYMDLLEMDVEDIVDY